MRERADRDDYSVQEQIGKTDGRTRGRRRLRTAFAACVTVVVLVGVFSASGVATAAPRQDAATLAAAAATTDAPGAALPRIGEDLVFKRAADDYSPWRNYSVKPIGTTGTFFLQPRDSDGCLFVDYFSLAVHLQNKGCNAADVTQRWYLVPQDRNPSSAPTVSRGGQYFYLVNAFYDKCLWKGSPGALDFDDRWANPMLQACASGDPGMEWQLNSDFGEGNANLQWANLLNLAAVHATKLCADDPGSCQIAPSSGAYAGEWFDVNDPALATIGTVSEQPLGCGTGSGTQNPNSSALSVSVSADQTLSSSLSVTSSLSTTTSAELTKEGLIDIWGLTVSDSFTVGTQTATAISTETNVSRSLSMKVPPFKWLMGSYSQQAYSLDGTWRLSMDMPGNLYWNMRALSTFPVSLDRADFASYTPTTSFAKKSCFAGPSAQNTAAPKLTSDLATCTQTTPSAPNGTVGSWVYVCPGSWSIPASTSAPASYAYQWYVTAGGVDVPHTGDPNKFRSDRFKIEPTTMTPGATEYLGVMVTETGTSGDPATTGRRLDSDPAPASNPVRLVAQTSTSGVAAPVPAKPDVTAFVSWLPDATVGQSYSTSIIADAGTRMNLSLSPGSALPDGLALSAVGVLSGTSTQSTSTTFTVVDAPTGTHAPTEHTFTFASHDPEATYVAADLNGTVDTPMNLPLVQSAPAAASFVVVDGALPTGVTLDPTTGNLTGTPSEAGVFSFSVGNAADLLPRTATFTLTVNSTRSQFSATTSLAGIVGTAGEWPLIQKPGSDSFIVLADGELPDGLTLDSATGTIAGTPTAAGTHTVSLIDSRVDDPSPTTFTIAVTGGPGPAGNPASDPPTSPEPTSSTPGTSAATGASSNLANTGASNLLPGLLGAVGLLLLGALGLARATSRRKAAR